MSVLMSRLILGNKIRFSVPLHPMSLLVVVEEVVGHFLPLLAGHQLFHVVFFLHHLPLHRLRSPCLPVLLLCHLLLALLVLPIVRDLSWMILSPILISLKSPLMKTLLMMMEAPVLSLLLFKNYFAPKPLPVERTPLCFPPSDPSFGADPSPTRSPSVEPASALPLSVLPLRKVALLFINVRICHLPSGVVIEHSDSFTSASMGTSELLWRWDFLGRLNHEGQHC